MLGPRMENRVGSEVQRALVIPVDNCPFVPVYIGFPDCTEKMAKPNGLFRGVS